MRSVLSADKAPHTNKEEVYQVKSLHVMYYRPFDRIRKFVFTGQFKKQLMLTIP